MISSNKGGAVSQKYLQIIMTVIKEIENKLIALLIASAYLKVLKQVLLRNK